MTNPGPRIQVFVRNAEGKVWGPVEPQSVQLMLESGLLQAPLEVSLNGLDFSTPDLVPEFSDAVPRERRIGLPGALLHGPDGVAHTA